MDGVPITLLVNGIRCMRAQLSVVDRTMLVLTVKPRASPCGTDVPVTSVPWW